MSAIPGGIWKVTIHELNRNIQQIGREVNTEEIADIVMNHAAATAVSAAASGVCPARATPVGAADGLPEQLSACLAVSDRADTIRMDAWRKILAFCARRDAATLVDARLAGDQPQERLKTLTAPALTLSPDALLELMLTGVPTDALAAELERLALALPDMPGDMGCYERMLYLALLGGSRVDLLARRVAVDQRCAELMMEYQCVLINALLLPLVDQPQAAFRAEIPARYLPR